MSVTKEKVEVELNLNTSILGKAKRDIAEFSRDGHLGFLHASNGAREFHKTLEGIVEQIPVLGLGLKAILSPIGAALTASTMVFSEVKGHIEEMNKEIDKAAEEAAKPVGLVREELNKLAMERQKQKSDEKHWLAELKEEHNVVLANLQDRLEYSQKIYDQRKKELGLNASAADLERIERERVKRDSSLYSAAGLSLMERIPSTERMATGAAAFTSGLKAQIAQAEASMKREMEYGMARSKRMDELDVQLSKGPGFNVLTPLTYKSWQYDREKAVAEREKLAKEEQGSLDRYKKLESTLKSLNGRLNESAYQAEHWKSKVEELYKEQESFQKLNHEFTQKYASFDGWGAGIPMADPNGGIAYRPLASRNIAYRPIPGAPGYKAPVSDVVALDPTKQAQATLTDLLVQKLRGQGIPVIGVE